MTIYATAYLEHYADLYADNMLHRHGVSLDQYLADPARYEHLLHAPFPLLRTQTRTRVRLIREETVAETEAELQDLPRQNGAYIEPLRHNRYPKKRGLLCRFRPARSPKPQPI
ncbi:MAG: hypothetical protein R3175_07365 [Marinobacter sp.]|uniref:hypothetical protein n=1 Tax=Marinobacter sp. TaxID=50741 RepID=UPI00299D0E6F|nr:hypothetical protein [Marinobacter sp.]MDX1755859.1 hypothetical protein [Marinobacter sp.]